MKIDELMYAIRIKDLVLPEFQREFVWRKDQAKKLISSLYKDYPVGSLLLWKTNAPPELKNIKTINKNSPYQLILDGQQRLTTLYLLIEGEIPPYYTADDITTDPRDLYFHLGTADLQYFQAMLMKNDPLWVSVTDCFDSTKDINVFALAKLIEDEAIQMDAANLYLNNLTKLRNIKQKELPQQMIPPSATIEDAIDIFDLVNSQGTKLTDAELALTHVVGKWPTARRVIKEKLEVLKQDRFDFNLSFMTRALTTVVTKRAQLEIIHTEPRAKLVAGWERLSKILDYLVSILPSKGYINSTGDMSTVNVLIPVIAYLNNNKGKFTDEANLNRALHFIYSALAWSRYSSQVDQRLEYDVSTVYRENNPWDKLIDALIDQRGRIEVSPNDLEGRTGGHPLYYLTFILAKSLGAIDWFNGLPLTSNLKGAYYVHSHHIFPSALLYKHDYDINNHLHRKIVNEIANRAFLTADSNIPLGDSRPEEYLPRIEEEYPGALVKQFVPMVPELWKLERFPEFLEARRGLIATKYNEHLKSLVRKPVKVVDKPILEIIELGESSSLEFKSTLQWDMVNEQKNANLRKSVLKTIVAFLNSDGGTLIIGVEDDKTVCGIEKDLILLQDSPDKFLNLISDLLLHSIGPEFAAFIKPTLHDIGGKLVCQINVDKAITPSFLTFNGVKEFYIRVATTSRALDPEETVDYIHNNWG